MLKEAYIYVCPAIKITEDTSTYIAVLPSKNSEDQLWKFNYTNLSSTCFSNMSPVSHFPTLSTRSVNHWMFIQSVRRVFPLNPVQMDWIHSATWETFLVVTNAPSDRMNGKCFSFQKDWRYMPMQCKKKSTTSVSFILRVFNQHRSRLLNKRIKLRIYFSYAPMHTSIRNYH